MEMKLCLNVIFIVSCCMAHTARELTGAPKVIFMRTFAYATELTISTHSIQQHPLNK